MNIIAALVPILIPFFVGVVLPVSIVYIVYRAEANKENKRAEIIIKAIEVNNDMDINSIVESLHEPKKSARDVLFHRLLAGCILTLLGLALLVYGIYAKYSFPELNYHHYSYLGGIVSLAIGIGYLVVYFVTRKQVVGSAEEK